MNMQNDDHTLLQRWAGGDTMAGGELLERHFRPLHRFLINKVPESDLLDLIQETMLACVDAREKFRGDASFTTFLFGIARNKLLHYYRRYGRKEGLLDPLSEATADFIDPSGVSSQLAKRREQELVLAALRTIPFDHQVVLELHFWEGLSARECAAVLGVPTSTIKGRLGRAKRSLKVALEAGSGSADEKRSISSAMASWILGIHDHIRSDSPEASRILKAWDDAESALEPASP